MIVDFSALLLNNCREERSHGRRTPLPDVPAGRLKERREKKKKKKKTEKEEEEVVVKY